MEKLKSITKFLWVPIAAVALWLVYKLFVAKDDNGELDITSSSTGLSPQDLSIYNEVISNLNSGGNPYNLTNIFFPLDGVDYAKGAVRLGALLNDVQDKPLFAQVFAKKQNKLLTSRIVEVYGDQVYSLVSQNVSNFQAFIL